MQLRWGDYDSHDVERYTRAKFLDYTTDNMVGSNDLPVMDLLLRTPVCTAAGGSVWFERVGNCVLTPRLPTRPRPVRRSRSTRPPLAS